MNNIDTNIDSLSKEEIIEALETLPAESANTLDETIEDVKAVATGILRHRIIKNYKADAEGITEEMIIGKLV